VKTASIQFQTMLGGKYFSSGVYKAPLKVCVLNPLMKAGERMKLPVHVKEYYVPTLKTRVF
jgi:hypothetical protein